jgi:putative tryptophan/tyrosine transport system substrate-binding protein
MSRLSRRQFVVGAAGLGLVVGCGRLPGQAEAPGRMPRIGVILPGDAPSGEWEWALEPLRQGLREHGYVDGRTILLEYRYEGGQGTQYPELVAELIALPVDVLVPFTVPAAVAARQVSIRVPIVLPVGDPIGVGLASSLARPGGNVTGLSVLSPTLSAKRVELLKDALPAARRVAVMWNLANPSKAGDLEETHRAAEALGLEPLRLPVESRDDLPAAFERMVRTRADVLLVVEDGLLVRHGPEIVALAAVHRLPAMYDFRQSVAAGGLMSYGPSLADNFRRAAVYVDKVLKGANPAELPIEQPMRFDFVVNMKTAQTLGITFPNEIMLQVTEVIQ